MTRVEEWREIPGFPLYDVSSLGRVRSRVPQFWNSKPIVEVPRIMALTTDKAGRKGVHLTTAQPGRKRRKPHTLRVHRLVMRAFVGPCPTGLIVCHNDGNSGNNRVENLRYDTHASNMLDKQVHDTQPRGEGMYSAKLNAGQVMDIRRRRAAGEKLAPLAAEFGVGEPTICSIAKGRLWSHLPLVA